MFTVTKYPQGTFSWADHASADPAAAKAFYSALFGWTVDDRPIAGTDMTYTMFRLDGHAVAGAVISMDDSPAAWTSYITVNDVDAVAAQVQPLGGKLVIPPTDVMGEGRMAIIQDLSGAHVGLWQAGAHIGAGLVNTVGAMCWNELYTDKAEPSQAFFKALLGWRYTVGEMDYITIKNQGRSNGGIVTMTEAEAHMPPHWLVYFTVADIRASAAKAESLGGNLVMPISEAGDGAMKFAVIADPLGATFTIIQAERLDPWVE